MAPGGGGKGDSPFAFLSSTVPRPAGNPSETSSQPSTFGSPTPFVDRVSILSNVPPARATPMFGQSHFFSGGTNNVGNSPGTWRTGYRPVTVDDGPGLQSANRSFTTKLPKNITSFQNIVFMEEYKIWSIEELRLADYEAGRGGGVQTSTAAFGSLNVSDPGLTNLFPMAISPFGVSPSAYGGFESTQAARFEGLEKRGLNPPATSETTRSKTSDGDQSKKRKPKNTNNAGQLLIMEDESCSDHKKRQALEKHQRQNLALDVDAGPSEWDDHTCDACGRKGHSLSCCIKISETGDVPGCPLCETIDHQLDYCLRLPDVRHRGFSHSDLVDPYKDIDERTLKELWFKLVVRPGLACIRSKRFSWPEMALREDLRCHNFLPPGSYPMSIEFAKRWQAEHPDDWETFDYKRGLGASTPHDPATWSLSQIRNNRFLVEKFRTPQDLAAEDKKRVGEEKLANEEGREPRLEAWKPMRNSNNLNAITTAQLVADSKSFSRA